MCNDSKRGRRPGNGSSYRNSIGRLASLQGKTVLSAWLVTRVRRKTFNVVSLIVSDLIRYFQMVERLVEE